ncbi:hypothetical protein AAVH_33498, partial [Aphelenchoides avenae]
NRKSPPIDSWEDELNRVLRDPTRSEHFSTESVRSYIQRQPVRAVDGIYAKVSLQCPLGRGARIEIPVRSQSCEHLQCFDLATYLKMHDRRLLSVKRHGMKLFGADASVENKYISWDCPICKKHAAVRDLHVDGYFNSLLLQYNDLRKVEEVVIKSDGSYQSVFKPKVEVFPVSDSPVLHADDGEAQAQVDEKPTVAHHLEMENADEAEVSADAMEITDLSLEQIRRLPETHQLCKEVKRRLLSNFKHMVKKKAMTEKPSNVASTTTTLMTDGLGPSGVDDATLSSGDAQGGELTRGSDDTPLSSSDADDTQLTPGDTYDARSSHADDAPLSSGDAVEQAQKSQTEVERLRSALADAEHAELVLHAENKQLQADLLASQKRVEAKEREKAQLLVEKQRLQTEKAALYVQMESDASLVAERAQQATLAEEKAQKVQSENGRLHETLAEKEHAILAQSEQIRRLESSLRETQARSYSNEREWSQQRVVGDRLDGDYCGQLKCIGDNDENASEGLRSADSSGPPGVNAAPKPTSHFQEALERVSGIAPLKNVTGNNVWPAGRRFHVKDNQEECLAPVESFEETTAQPPIRSHAGPAGERYVVMCRPPPGTLKGVVKHRDERSCRHRQAKRIVIDHIAQVHEYDRDYTAHMPLRDNELGPGDIPREVSFEPENAQGMSHADFSLPCSDMRVRGRRRWQPNKKNKLKANVLIEVGKMVAHFQEMDFSGGTQY